MRFCRVGGKRRRVRACTGTEADTDADADVLIVQEQQNVRRLFYLVQGLARC